MIPPDWIHFQLHKMFNMRKIFEFYILDLYSKLIQKRKLRKGNNCHFGMLLYFSQLHVLNITKVYQTKETNLVFIS